MPPAKTPADQLHEAYLETLQALNAQAEASRERMDESSRALLDTNRASLEQLAERLIEASERRSQELAAMLLARASEPREVVIQSPAESPTEREQRLKQKQLILSYDAFRTMLGRAPASGASGAATVFFAERVDEQGESDGEGESIRIVEPAPFAGVEDGWTLVAITSQQKTLTARLTAHTLPVRVQVPRLSKDIDISRLEIRDASGDPIYLGIGPATRTQNAQLQRHRHEPDRADPSRDLRPIER